MEKWESCYADGWDVNGVMGAQRRKSYFRLEGSGEPFWKSYYLSGRTQVIKISK